MILWASPGELSATGVSAMKDLFPYLGEAILRELLSADPKSLTTMFPHLASASVQVFQTVPLSFPGTGISFDGFQKLDLAMLIDGKQVLPIEVKLGRTGLSRAIINRKLTKCSISRHVGERRVSGNMLAVLSRVFDERLSELVGSVGLHARIDGREFPLTEEWVLIARRRVLSSWKTVRPEFNERAHFVALEDVCEAAGRERFNQVVLSLFAEFDFFDEWVGPTRLRNPQVP